MAGVLSPMSEERGSIEALDEFPQIEKIARETVHDQIYQEIRAGLMSGRFYPGQKLKLRPLAKAFGTSPLPVRDALGRLVAESALAMLPNRTVAVPPITPDRLEDIWRVRVLIERDATETAARFMTDEVLGELRRLNAAMKTGTDDLERYLAHNRAFHFLIYRTARSPVSMKVIESLWLQAGPLLRLIQDVETPLRSGVAVSHHEDALEAFARGEAARAGAAIAEDLEHGALYLRRRLAAASDAAPPAERRAAR